MSTTREHGHAMGQYEDHVQTVMHLESKITNELRRMIHACREATGKNMPQLAAKVNIDSSYLFRLEFQQRA